MKSLLDSSVKIPNYQNGCHQHSSSFDCNGVASDSHQCPKITTMLEKMLPQKNYSNGKFLSFFRISHCLIACKTWLTHGMSKHVTQTPFSDYFNLTRYNFRLNA